MKELNYETLLTLHYTLLNVKHELMTINQHKNVIKYYQTTSKEIDRRLSLYELGHNRVAHFPWGTQEQYVDFSIIDSIIDDITVEV